MPSMYLLLKYLSLFAGAGISFSQDAYFVDESEGSLSVMVNLTLEEGALLERNVTVNVTLDTAFGDGIIIPERLANDLGNFV